MGEEKQKNKSENKKILFVASAFSHIINFHSIYFKYLCGMGYEIHVAAGDDNSDITKINSDKNFALAFNKSKNLLKNITTVFALRKIIRREKYDIVSTHSMLAGFIGRLAVMLAFDKKIKAVHTCHGYLFDDDKSFKSKLMILNEKFLSRRTGILFVMNGDDYNIAKKYKLCQKIEFINGMGISKCRVGLPCPTVSQFNVGFQRCGMEAAPYDNINIPDSKKYFLCVGEFSKRKNQKNILRAIKKLCEIAGQARNDVDATAEYHFIFLGGGGLLDECKKLCETLGITEYVTFCGHVSETAPFYESAYCVVSVGRFEGLPFNVMEALHHGKPVIASDIKGHRDLISHGFNGYLYKFNDDAELCGLFEKIARDDIYEALKSNAHLDEKYYFDCVKDKVLYYYRTIAEDV